MVSREVSICREKVLKRLILRYCIKACKERETSCPQCIVRMLVMLKLPPGLLILQLNRHSS